MKSPHRRFPGYPAALALVAALVVFVMGAFAGITDEPDLDGPPLEPATDYYAVMHTSKGIIAILLRPDVAPENVRNFVNLAEGSKPWQDPYTRRILADGMFDGMIFNRVVAGVAIHSGCPLATGRGGPGFTVPDEIDPATSLVFDSGDYLLAMENEGTPDTNGSRFYITVGGSKPIWRNLRDTIIGEVVAGREVVDAIGSVKVGPDSVPIEEVVLVKCQIVRVPAGTPREANPWASSLMKVDLTTPARWRIKPSDAPMAEVSKEMHQRKDRSAIAHPKMRLPGRRPVGDAPATFRGVPVQPTPGES